MTRLPRARRPRSCRPRRGAGSARWPRPRARSGPRCSPRRRRATGSGSRAATRSRGRRSPRRARRAALVAEPPLFEARGDFVDGRFTPPERADGELVAIDPGDTRAPLGAFPFAASSVERAFDAARRAWPAWRDTAPDARADALRRFAEALETDAERLASAIALEVG